MCFRGVDPVDHHCRGVATEDRGHRIAKLKLKGRAVELIRPALNDKFYVFIFSIIIDPR